MKAYVIGLAVRSGSYKREKFIVFLNHSEADRFYDEARRRIAVRFLGMSPHSDLQAGDNRMVKYRNESELVCLTLVSAGIGGTTGKLNAKTDGKGIAEILPVLARGDGMPVQQALQESPLGM